MSAFQSRNLLPLPVPSYLPQSFTPLAFQTLFKLTPSVESEVEESKEPVSDQTLVSHVLSSAPHSLASVDDVRRLRECLLRNTSIPWISSFKIFVLKVHDWIPFLFLLIISSVSFLSVGWLHFAHVEHSSLLLNLSLQSHTKHYFRTASRNGQDQACSEERYSLSQRFFFKCYASGCMSFCAGIGCCALFWCDLDESMFQLVEKESACTSCRFETICGCSLSCSVAAFSLCLAIICNPDFFVRLFLCLVFLLLLGLYSNPTRRTGCCLQSTSFRSKGSHHFPSLVQVGSGFFKLFLLLLMLVTPDLAFIRFRIASD